MPYERQLGKEARTHERGETVWGTLNYQDTPREQELARPPASYDL
jgi:hypothetical protein